MKHFILNLADGSRDRAAARLHARMWALSRDERHCGALARGDLVLIHVGQPRCAFIGRAELATEWRDWTPAQSAACPEAESGGVLLAQVEDWPHAVPLEAVVQRIDPTASNPYVQANAGGFRSGIIEITAGEHDAVVALSRVAPRDR